MNIEYRFNVPCYSDRERMVIAFANSGHSVRIEETETNEAVPKTEYWVVVEPKKEARP